ncbi:MAG: GNAT family N-acetyltransferase [Anaerococcus prevotii]|uniref:GNAT family N-acetyltransferase n=1 Tax=Anaerococcus prevotii TaxID=33034 RepID=UPI0028FF6D46|nr:GNAT family N-acetyltransferase [Anaerococcus prevotii]MDU2558956.1 GNAT family N-acetyltransferase [Anaerococcus prevotii]MDU2585459.1 GNAT family N-acetyltransferase [Anaerococcus prevotii]
MKIESIASPRLIIRSFVKEDAYWAYQIWNDTEMGEYLPDESKEGVDLAYIKELEELENDPDCTYLIPISKETKKRVGTCSFLLTDGGDTYDIAYCVHKSLWNKGYATEIAQALISYARKKGASKVSIIVNQDNMASRRVAEKCSGKIVREDTFIKKGSGEIKKTYKYEIKL